VSGGGKVFHSVLSPERRKSEIGQGEVQRILRARLPFPRRGLPFNQNRKEIPSRSRELYDQRRIGIRKESFISPEQVLTEDPE